MQLVPKADKQKEQEKKKEENKQTNNLPLLHAQQI